MTNRTVAPLSEQVSLLGFGAMRFPQNEDGTIERVESEKMIDVAYQNGVNYFDTAYMYHNGESQSFLGEALKKYDRKSFFITNKMPVWMADTKEDIARIFEDQLQKCQVEYFDFYLVHAISTEHLPKIREFDVYNYLNEQKSKGRIKNLGFSFHDTPEVLEQVCAEWKWDFAQLQLNYLDWEFQKAKEQYDILVKYQLPCVVMEPVRGGTLANLPEDVCTIFKGANPNRSIASWAIRFCASLPNVLTVLSGMSLPEQVADNLDTMTDFVPLTDAEQDTIQEALTVFKKNNLVPCTECKYCIDCPIEINIPEIFKRYNAFRINKNEADFLRGMQETAGCTPDACVSCGACVTKCPQHINIPAELEKIAALLAK